VARRLWERKLCSGKNALEYIDGTLAPIDVHLSLLLSPVTHHALRRGPICLSRQVPNRLLGVGLRLGFWSRVH
jgi:hypothetical protein